MPAYLNFSYELQILELEWSKLQSDLLTFKNIKSIQVIFNSVLEFLVPATTTESENNLRNVEFPKMMKAPFKLNEALEYFRTKYCSPRSYYAQLVSIPEGANQKDHKVLLEDHLLS
jgi:hypothetical protein